MTDLKNLLTFAKKHSDLGGNVQEQLHDLIDGNFDDINPNAIDLIYEKLGGLNDSLDELIGDYHFSNNPKLTTQITDKERVEVSQHKSKSGYDGSFEWRGEKMFYRRLNND